MLMVYTDNKDELERRGKNIRGGRPPLLDRCLMVYCPVFLVDSLRWVS
jgi:hypothetical protein